MKKTNIIIQKKIKNFFKKSKSKITFVHVDISRTFRIKFINKNNFFKAHYLIIKNITNNSSLWFPSFNYDFSKNKRFKIESDKSQTDSFTEFFRKKLSKWRTSVPIFSICGDNSKPKIHFKNSVNPFGKNSFFHLLYKSKSNILFYGAPLNSASFIMYIEDTLPNGPVYRFKKKINGTLIFKKKKNTKISLVFNVRPVGKNFPIEYDWHKIESTLYKAKLIKSFKYGIIDIKILNLFKVTKYLQKKISKNPFYLLNKRSLIWAKPLYKKLGRRFHIKDFE